MAGPKALAADPIYRYKGVVDVRVFETNGAQYIVGAHFQSGYSKPVNYKLRFYNGKAALETFKPFYEKNNGDDKRTINITHKYFFSMRIRENDHQSFSATVKLHQRRKDKKIDINKPYRFADSDFKVVSSQPIKGRFNEDNEYLFVDRADLKFYVKLNFDLIFTEKEIRQRFEQGKHQSDNGN